MILIKFVDSLVQCIVVYPQCYYKFKICALSVIVEELVSCIGGRERGRGREEGAGYKTMEGACTGDISPISAFFQLFSSVGTYTCWGVELRMCTGTSSKGYTRRKLALGEEGPVVLIVFGPSVVLPASRTVTPGFGSMVSTWPGGGNARLIPTGYSKLL